MVYDISPLSSSPSANLHTLDPNSFTTRGPDPNRPTTWGPDHNPNPNRPMGRELSENWHKPIFLTLSAIDFVHDNG